MPGLSAQRDGGAVHQDKYKNFEEGDKNAGKDVEQWELLFITGGNAK